MITPSPPQALPAGGPHRTAALAWVTACVGTALNPLNSSMIAIALVQMQHAFHVETATASWTIIVFYIGSVVGQPLMGRFVDVFGARRVFVAGMLVVALAGLGGLAHSFVVVCGARAVLALGTSVAFPASVSLASAVAARSGRTPVQLLGWVQIANTAAAALGPVAGGVVVLAFGWRGVLLVNIPIAMVALVGALLFLPREAVAADAPPAHPWAMIRGLDLPGIVTFAAAASLLTIFALGTAPEPRWIHLAVGLAALMAFIGIELRASAPFIDLRLILRTRSLAGIYAGFAVFSTLFYLAFFGVPQFLEVHGGYSPAASGVLLLPLAASTVVLAPATARAIDKHGAALILRLGAASLVVACGILCVGAYSVAWPWMLVAAGAIGVPYCLVALSVTQTLHAATSPAHRGSASGVLQSFRYIGAIAATVILSRTFGSAITARDWLTICAIALVLAIAHLLLVLLLRTGTGKTPADASTRGVEMPAVVRGP